MPLYKVNLTKTQQILLDAAAEVRKGWCQGIIEDVGGNVCAVEAIKRAAGLGMGSWNVSAEGAVLRVQLFIGTALPYWNDEPGRTSKEIALVLEAAAFSKES